MAKPKIDFDNPVVGGQGGGFEAGPRLIISGKSRFRVFRRQLSKKEQEELEKQNLSEDELEARTNEILGEPKLVFTLEMKRLTDDGDVIMVGSGDDEHELVEVKNFGLGGKALHVLHPGKADSADDDDPSDMGTDVDAEGNTVYCEDAAAFQIHNKSAFFKLQESAVKAGMKPEIVHRLWAPDWDGMVVVLDQEADAEMQMPSRKQGAKPGETEALRYVVIKEILKHASKGSGPKAGAKGDAKADAKDSKAGKGGKADSGDDEVSKLAVKYLRKISEENDGKTLSVKTVLTALSKAMSADKATAQVVPVTTLVKEAKWLEANASKFDATYNDDDRELKFGDGE